MTSGHWLLGSCGMLAVLLMVGHCCALAQDDVKFEDEKMYVDGKPFLHWGFIWSGHPLEMLKQFRFNAQLGTRKQAEYDQAVELGIHLMAPHTNAEVAPEEWLPSIRPR